MGKGGGAKQYLQEKGGGGGGQRECALSHTVRGLGTYPPIKYCIYTLRDAFSDSFVVLK